MVSVADRGEASSGTLERGLSVLEFFAKTGAATASDAVSGVDAVRLAPAYLRDLVEKTLETVFLAVVDEGDVVYVYREEGPQAVKMSSQLGSRRPVHCTALGKAYMSALPDDVRRASVDGLNLRRFTGNTITDAAELKAELLATKKRGYAVDQVEVEEGVACFGAPLRDHRGLPVAAISVAGPAGRLLPKEEEVGPLVAKTASAISRRLGCVEAPSRK